MGTFAEFIKFYEFIAIIAVPYLTIDTFPYVMILKAFLDYIWADLFSAANTNRYLTRGSNGNVLAIATTGNVFVTNTPNNYTIFWIL